MTTATPTADHILPVRDKGETYYLPEEQAQTFHHTVAQLLRHTEVGGIPYHSFEETRRGRLGKTEVIIEIPQGNKETETNSESWRHVSSEMVGRRFIHGAWRLMGTHRSYELPGKRISVQFLHKKNINGKSSAEGELIGLNDVMAKILL